MVDRFNIRTSYHKTYPYADDYVVVIELPVANETRLWYFLDFIISDVFDELDCGESFGVMGDDKKSIVIRFGTQEHFDLFIKNFDEYQMKALLSEN